MDNRANAEQQEYWNTVAGPRWVGLGGYVERRVRAVNDLLLAHGCFWHQHPGCRLASSPKSRQNYWVPKLSATVERDRRNARHLREIGWRVETIWECDTRKAERLASRVGEIVESLSAEQRRCCAKTTKGPRMDAHV